MDPFRIAFLVMAAAMVAVRMTWHLRARVHQPGVANPSEGWWVTPMRILVLPVFLALVGLWLVAPQSIPWLLAPLPAAVRWAGVPVFALGLGLLVWVHWTLGKNFSPYLRIRADHHLVTGGPYRYARHPMYTAFLLLAAGLGLVSAHWLLLVTMPLMIVAIVVFRTPREEAMLEERFGDDWRAYRQRTGALLPRVRRDASAPNVGA